MATRQWPQPSEQSTWPYRRAHRLHDLEPVGRYERAGFGSPSGFRGAYAERRAYRARRAELYPPEPEGSGWPHPLHHVPRRMEARHLRALQDRELARAVDLALYNVIPPSQADRISVYADDAVITLAGVVDDPETAHDAVEAARYVPGVLEVRDALRYVHAGTLRYGRRRLHPYTGMHRPPRRPGRRRHGRRSRGYAADYGYGY